MWRKCFPRVPIFQVFRKIGYRRFDVTFEKNLCKIEPTFGGNIFVFYLRLLWCFAKAALDLLLSKCIVTFRGRKSAFSCSFSFARNGFCTLIDKIDREHKPTARDGPSHPGWVAILSYENCSNMANMANNQIGFLLTKRSWNRQERHRLRLGTSSDRPLVAMMDGPLPSYPWYTVSREDLSTEGLYPSLFRRDIGFMVSGERYGL